MKARFNLSKIGIPKMGIPITAALAGLAALGARSMVLGSSIALRAVLSPAALALRLFFGLRPQWVAGRGYLVAESGMILTQACSGLSYFCLSLPLLILITAPGGQAMTARFLLRVFILAFGMSLGGAFLSNLMRIISAQALGPLKAAFGLSFYSAHHLEGALIFLAGFFASAIFMKRTLSHVV